MFHDGWGFMMRKYVDDAEKILAAGVDRQRPLQRRRQRALQRNRILKRCFLGVALAGVVAGLYFAHDFGGMLGTTISSARLDVAPVIEPPPPSKAKFLRKLSENRKGRENELEEIENF